MNDIKRAGNRWLLIKITPNASRNEITGLSGGVLQIKIVAPPERGKANKELITFLSRVLGVKKSDVAIVKGETSRNKAITIAGMTREDIIKRLTSYMTEAKTFND